MKKQTLSTFNIVLLLLASPPLYAGEGVFGWLYTLDLQPQGTVEFEQKSWIQHRQSKGSYDNVLIESELEYGVTNNYQIALYLNNRYLHAYQNGITGQTSGPNVQYPANASRIDRYRQLKFDSIAIENIWRVTNPYTDPVGIGLYLEPSIGPRTKELESRVLLQSNFLDDRLIIAANIAAKSEQESLTDTIKAMSAIDITLGTSYRFINNLAAGLEYRNHREFQGYRFNSQEHSAHFLGPSLHYAQKNWWMTLAWRHQLPAVKTFNQAQQDEVVNHRIYGDEHVRDELIVKIGFPF